MSGRNQWVVRRDGLWAVRGEGCVRDTSHHDTQEDAITVAREIAHHQHAGIVIQGRNGRIRERHFYG